MPAMLIQAKQIEKVLSCGLRINGFITTNGNTSDTITTQVSTLLATAGAGNTAVPVQVSTDEFSVGVIATGTNNRVEIWDATTRLKIQDGSGNEVYGRITEAAGVYTLSYYSVVSGTETAFTFDGRDIDFTLNYRFDFRRYPSDCNISVSSRNVNDDPVNSGQGREECEVLAVTALNTVASLSFTPNSTAPIKFSVNGQSFLEGGAGPFSVAGTTVTWTPTGLYDLETDDCVEVCYYTNQGV